MDPKHAELIAAFVNATRSGDLDALTIEDGVVRAVYAVRNSDKLRHVPAARRAAR